MARTISRGRMTTVGAALLCGGLVALTSSIAVERAEAAACGGVTPCSCGDTVVASRTLTAADPVTTVVCPGDGLGVDPGVTLGLGGQTITGSGSGQGVALDTGSTVVGPGTITSFAHGVYGITNANGLTVNGVTVTASSLNGIDLFSDGNTVDGSTAVGSAFYGIVVTGDGNIVTSNTAKGNLAGGIRVTGDNNTVKSNRAEGNGGIGIDISGDQNPVAGDDITGNKVQGSSPVVTPAAGLRVTGANHGINGNTVERYATGFDINGAMRKVSSNTAQDDGVGFLFEGNDTQLVNGNRAFRNTAGDGVGYRVTGSGNFFKGNRSGTRNKGNKTGWDISGSQNRFESNRAENNAGTAAGNGFEIGGALNTFKNDRANNNGGNGFHLATSSTGNAFQGTRAQSNVVNGYLVEGKSNTFLGDRAVANGAVGFDVGAVAPGDGNTLTGTQASRNVTCQYEIGANNIDGGGNRANGPVITFDAAGGNFCPANPANGGGSSTRPPQAAIRADEDRNACAATCPVTLDGSRSSGMIATFTFSVTLKSDGSEVVPPTASGSPTLDVDLAPGEYVVTLEVDGPTGTDTESRGITVRL